VPWKKTQGDAIGNFRKWMGGIAVRNKSASLVTSVVGKKSSSSVRASIRHWNVSLRTSISLELRGAEEGGGARKIDG
jgi:hypothetical protein